MEKERVSSRMHTSLNTVRKLSLSMQESEKNKADRISIQTSTKKMLQTRLQVYLFHLFT